MMMLACLAMMVSAAVMPPRATIADHDVTFAAEELRIAVPERAHYVGGERFVLYDNADAELHVFVEADADRTIRRFYWVQSEAYLPSVPDARYTYGKRDRRTTLWGETAWIASGFGRTDFETRPGSDRDHLRSILARAGYMTPPTMMQVRMVRLLDDPEGSGFGRRELMLIYAEDLALGGEDFEALGGEGEDTDRWRAIEPALVERAAAAFRVTNPR